MTDKRQVMYDIERCISHVPGACMKCSHYTGTVGFVCMENLMSDALTMLKEQEAVEPNVTSTEQRCGNCNKVIEMDGWKSCPWCGKPIAWSEWWNKNGERSVK